MPAHVGRWKRPAPAKQQTDRDMPVYNGSSKNIGREAGEQNQETEGVSISAVHESTGTRTPIGDDTLSRVNTPTATKQRKKKNLHSKALPIPNFTALYFSR